MENRNGLRSVKQMFAFPFRDPHWKAKFLIGSGLVAAGMFFPLLPWLPLLGFCARVTRRAAGLDLHTNPVPAPEITEDKDTLAPAAVAQPEMLPEWDGWADLFMDGLRQMGTLVLCYFWPLLAAPFGFYVALMLYHLSGLAYGEAIQPAGLQEAKTAG